MNRGGIRYGKPVTYCSRDTNRRAAIGVLFITHSSFTPLVQMKFQKLIGIAVLCLAVLMQAPQGRCDDLATAFRPPAVPLVACDPYFSVWSQADNLWQTPTTHWTGTVQRMAAIVRVDGRPYRLMGASPQTIAAMEQKSVEVRPTQTIYHFTSTVVDVMLTFTTPSLPDDIAILSRPTTYIDCEVTSVDGQTHEVDFYFDAGGELATNETDQQVVGSAAEIDGITALKIGTESQPVLGRSGDDLRIDWGYLYVAADASLEPAASFGDADSLRLGFGQSGINHLDQPATSFPIDAGDVVASIAMSVGTVGQEPVSASVLIAYDDLYSIEFMKKRLRPYWRKDGWEASDLISAAMNEHDALDQTLRPVRR